MSKKSFSLWPHTEVEPYSLPMAALGDDITRDFSKVWLDRFHGYDYGAMTVWLMRGFGLPNVRAYDTHKHGFRWALETTQGYVIEVEPQLLSISRKEYAGAFEQRVPGARAPSKNDFVNRMAGAGIFTIRKVNDQAPPITSDLFEAWLDQFARPIYIRDVGATVIGGIHDSPWISDVGPGDRSVLSGGQELADNPTVASPSKRSNRP